MIVFMKNFINNLSKFSYTSLKLSKRDYDTPLGRWNVKANYFNQNVSNHDHCGDRLCGDPKFLRKMLRSKQIKDGKDNKSGKKI